MPAKLSVATIDAPEFIHITSISPTIAKCEIKVLYVGGNRNGSFISKEVASEMAQTLPGVPIVGHYIENKEDFGDHGEQIIIDDEGVKFNTLTVPYGFVAPDARIWFQKFQETDEFGNVTIRDYLMTEGYLWVKQYEECKRILEDGNYQSMELDEESLQGYWSTNTNKGVEFFIINDAIFSKLCILGEDVEPCFEGATITAPEVSSKFTKDETFNRTLFSMMKELKETIETPKGEVQMPTNENMTEEVAPTVQENFSENSDKTLEINEEKIENTVENTFENAESTLEANSEEVSTAEEPVAQASEEVAPEAEFSATEEAATPVAEEPVATPAEEVAPEAPATAEFAKDEDEKPDDDKSDDKKDANKEEEEEKYSLLESEYNTLKNQYAELEAKYNELVAFKADVDRKEKDNLINSFSMLTDADKADVIQNIDKYSLNEIESKLSILFARKQMKATEEVVEEKAVNNEPIIFTAADDLSAMPEWVKAVKEVEKNL